mgnify:CR=1 FL=1
MEVTNSSMHISQKTQNHSIHKLIEMQKKKNHERTKDKDEMNMSRTNNMLMLTK